MKPSRDPCAWPARKCRRSFEIVRYLLNPGVIRIDEFVAALLRMETAVNGINGC